MDRDRDAHHGVGRSSRRLAVSSGRWWVAALVAAVAGVVLTGVQIVEKIAVLSEPDASLFCDVNAVFSCSGVLAAWQSSVLGPPNSLVGAVLFTVFASAAAVVVSGGHLSRSFVLGLWAASFGFAGFATWFMVQTAYVIGALCLWCIGITTATLVLCAALTRQVAASQVLSGRPREWLGTLVAARADLVLLVGWWLALAAVLVTGLVR